MSDKFLTERECKMSVYGIKAVSIFCFVGLSVVQLFARQHEMPAAVGDDELSLVRGGQCYNLSNAVNCATNPSTAGLCKNQLCGTDPMGYHNCTTQSEKGTAGGGGFSVVQIAPQGAAGKENGTNGQALCFTDYECQIGYFCDQDPMNLGNYYCKSNGKKINTSYTMSGVLGGASCSGAAGGGGGLAGGGGGGYGSF